MGSLSSGMERLPDRFVDFGPMGGILSAFERDRRSAWLVLACDMPLLTPESIASLVQGRDPWRMATALRDPAKSFPEPLAAIWEPKARGVLLGRLARDIRCPRRALEANRIAQGEIAPVSRHPGDGDYKRALLRQHLLIHFMKFSPGSVTLEALR